MLSAGKKTLGRTLAVNTHPPRPPAQGAADTPDTDASRPRNETDPCTSDSDTQRLEVLKTDFGRCTEAEPDERYSYDPYNHPALSSDNQIDAKKRTSKDLRRLSALARLFRTRG